MAKLKAPLLSLGAAGALGNTLVFFNWKGIDVAREYVIPSNPKSDDQITQRGYMKTIVPAIHAAQVRATQPMTTTDYAAYSALATKLGITMTWFNMVVKLALDGLRLSDGYTVYSGGYMGDSDKDDFRPRVFITDNGVLQVADGKFYLGTSPTNLLKSVDAGIVAGSDAEPPPLGGFDGLVAGTKYYWQFRPDAGDPCEGAVTGIYSAVAT